MKDDIRWTQRFQNYERAFVLLKQALDDKDLNEFNMLEKEGLIQRFEYTFELAWKTIKDYLIDNGIILQEVTPRSVIKEAFSSGIIKDGQIFINMMLSRNLLSHCYDSEKFNEVLALVKNNYLDELFKLYQFFLERIGA